jgi:hypothetical protein
MPLTEDRRAAAAIVTGISNYVATAALAVLAGAVALFTFVTQFHKPGTAFYITIAAGAILLVAAIFVGGKGSQAVAESVGDETWDSSADVCEYDWQAILTLLGLVAVIAAVVIGVTAPERSDALAQRVLRLERQVTQLTASQRSGNAGARAHAHRVHRDP